MTFGPRRLKVAPAVRTIDALCMTSSWDKSLYDRLTESTRSSRMRAVRSFSGTIGIPSG
ncbi:hypothetical protein D3C83_323680 [compost metagenome]